MATLFFGVTGPTLDLRQDLTILDTDAPRIMAYLMASAYGTVTENVITDIPNPAWSPDQPDPLDPPEFIQQQSWVSRPATPEEAVIAYAQSLMNTLLQQAYQWDQQQAAAEAAANVPPITPVIPPTPVPPAP